MSGCLGVSEHLQLLTAVIVVSSYTPAILYENAQLKIAQFFGTPTRMASFFSRPQATMSSEPPSPTPPSDPQSQPQQQHQLQQQSQSRLPNSLKLLFGGTAFFALSLLITRRAIARKRIATTPPFYTTASYHRPRVNGAMEALEALNIATINVASLAMIGVGGTMYATGINTMDDLRRAVRGGTGADGTGRSESEVEEQLEEWVASVLGRKSEKDKEGKAEEETKGGKNR